MSDRKDKSNEKKSGRKKKSENVHSLKNTGREKNSKKVKAAEVNQRDDHRVPIQLLVDYRANGNYLFDFCYNLGSGGVFIQTEKPLPKGSELDLVFTLPDSKQTLRAKGQVMWLQPAMPEMKQVTPGMGVQFRNFSAEDRRTLEAFLSRYRDQSSTVDRSA